MTSKSETGAVDDSLPQSVRVFNELRRAILSFDLRPGQPMLEIELAQRFGVSRTPVREAIRRLSMDGLVDVIPYKGGFVRTLTRNEVQEIYETAEGLEGMAAFLAAQRGGADGIKLLGKAVRELKRAFKRDEMTALVDADEAFHRTLHQLASNKYLVDSLARLHEQVHRVRYLTARAFNKNPKSVEEHAATFEAIRAGDAELARQITQRHWQRVRSETMTLLP